ncbi:cytochrome-c peroxidase [Hymenobacter oligotrophus]|uniref:Cytochrome-c peroxidase n=1 Tax=Hymenobacter oligotrophus TaxID=2319843 RepID=A0A3B7QYP2_9BACT|nr:cytochrome c peroxidase [Hymenobacter oligotrophus]AYA36964.1 cytochrome-c peroxidase [Hymenobacter oligotrophus]
MQRLVAVLLSAALAGLLVGSCRPDADWQPVQELPGSALPSRFPAPAYAPDQNPPDRAAFELGRKLFYDARLSRDGSVSCGSCHQQTHAFADAGHALSLGVGGRQGSRNTPALQNLRWRRSLLWDGGVAHLEMLPLAPLANPAEMNETLPNVLRKLNADADYRQRFAQAYGAGPIGSQQFLKALAQFLAGFTSANSRYDQYVRNESDGTLAAPEVRGLLVFKANCAGCHATDLFTDESFRNNGLDRGFAADSGRAHITGRAADRGLFKVPSLRNVARTAPYMHDGRFGTLEQVLDHYNTGVVESPTLDPQLRRPGGRLGIALTVQQKSDLRAFLLTLTDEQFLNNPQLAKPR